ncbi:MAG: cytochrome c oxidase subunit II, partial [Solirubrobacterales bacterium]|nr:cytochrome c oxidase subunit II [Solirubrobacterales bacterium]
SEPRHAIRIVGIWAGLTVICVPLVIFVLGPHIPPGHASQQSSDQHQINVVLTTLATPIVLMVWVYFGYAITVFRQAGETIVDGPPIDGNARIQLTWLSVTSAIVLGLAVYGTIDLFSASAAGAGGGQGPNPLAKPANVGSALEVQVIGQQWLWTFRYPGYGGVETATLALPVNREIAIHVTSLDVAHSFWAYELGVKADAIPGSDNVVYVKPEQIRSFQVRCAELCGLWHGHMNTTGRVLSQPDFGSWIAQQEQQYAAVTKQLPPYSHVYYPSPLRRAP